MNSVTVWDDEVMRPIVVSGKTIGGSMGDNEVKRTVAVRKGMPHSASSYGRRNDSDNGTIFEW